MDLPRPSLPVLLSTTCPGHTTDLKNSLQDETTMHTLAPTNRLLSFSRGEKRQRERERERGKKKRTHARRTSRRPERRRDASRRRADNRRRDTTRTTRVQRRNCRFVDTRPVYYLPEGYARRCGEGKGFRGAAHARQRTLLGSF